MYMLDTNICIYIMKQRPASVLERFEKMSLNAVCMSLVTDAELRFGAVRSNNTGKALQTLGELARYIPVKPLLEETAQHYAEIRAGLAARGTPIGNSDLWIAAHARSLGCTLVTHNTKEFERVDGLRSEEWV